MHGLAKFYVNYKMDLHINLNDFFYVFFLYEKVGERWPVNQHLAVRIQ